MVFESARPSPAPASQRRVYSRRQDEDYNDPFNANQRFMEAEHREAQIAFSQRNPRAPARRLPALHPVAEALFQAARRRKEEGPLGLDNTADDTDGAPPSSDGNGSPASPPQTSDGSGSPASSASGSKRGGSPVSSVPTSDGNGSPASPPQTSDGGGGHASNAASPLTSSTSGATAIPTSPRTPKESLTSHEVSRLVAASVTSPSRQRDLTGTVSQSAHTSPSRQPTKQGFRAKAKEAKAAKAKEAMQQPLRRSDRVAAQNSPPVQPGGRTPTIDSTPDEQRIGMGLESCAPPQQI